MVINATFSLIGKILGKLQSSSASGNKLHYDLQRVLGRDTGSPPQYKVVTDQSKVSLDGR